MEVIGDQWIMKGCIPGCPGCVYQPEELVTLLEQVGFLPLFSNEIPGFSVEEHVLSAAWWSGDPENDPWEWRQVLAGHPRVAYGKFFDRKAVFIGIRAVQVRLEHRPFLIHTGHEDHSRLRREPVQL